MGSNEVTEHSQEDGTIESTILKQNRKKKMFEIMVDKHWLPASMRFLKVGIYHSYE